MTSENSIASEGSVVSVNGNSNCRIVIGQGLSLYAAPGQTEMFLQMVNSGQQVGLENSTSTVQGADGLPYIYISVPFNGQNPSLGYIQSQVRNADTGVMESTLGLCSNTDNSTTNSNSNNTGTTGSNNSDDSNGGPVGAYW